MKNELKPYEKYKEANLLWLECIPKHWQMLRNKSLLKLQNGMVGQNHIKYTLLSLTKAGIIVRDMVNPKGKFPKDFGTYQIVNEKNIVFCLFDIDETPRTVGLSPVQGMITGAYTVFKIENVCEKYLYYYYLSIDNVKSLKPLYTGLRKVITTDTFLRTKMPVPPIEEQNQIVKYLDYQLFKINKFIKTKKKLIEVLKEQKQAVINEAVTKGINPDVKMKPSGIEWLGDIPEHWEVTRNKNLFKQRKEIVGEKHKDYMLLSLTVNGVIIRDIESGKGKFPTDFFTYQEVKKGNMIFCFFDVEETPRTVGVSEFNGMITGAYTVFEVSDKTRDYLYYYYFALDQKKGLKTLYTGLRKVIPVDVFLRSKVSQPPEEEQIEIVEYIKSKTKVIDKSISKIEKEISLISEYKTRLISDVVTGKVDVRNIVIDEEITENTEIEEEFDKEDAEVNEEGEE